MPETTTTPREEHRARKREEPAAASLETDAEAGAQVSPTRPDGVAPAHTRRRETRAGPGDAGAAARPERLPEDESLPASFGWIPIAVVCLIVAGLALLFV